MAETSLLLGFARQRWPADQQQAMKTEA